MQDDYQKKTTENMQQYTEFANACRKYVQFLSKERNLTGVQIREVITSAATDVFLHEMLDV